MKSENVKQAEQVKAVAVKQENSVMVKHQVEATGFEDMTDDVSVILPVVKVMQATSPELDMDGVDFKKGNLVHSLLLEKMPEKFVPIKFFDTKILLVPKSEEKKEALRIRLNLTQDEINSTNIICQSKDGKTGSKYGDCASCGLSKWNNESGEKPVCTHSINVLSVFVEPDGELQAFPSVLRFANTSFKHGRKLLSMAKMSKKIYNTVYKASSKQVSADGNSWYELVAVPSGRPTPEQAAELENIFSDFSSLKFEVSEDVPADDIQEVGEISEY
jgi:hypothetical protein